MSDFHCEVVRVRDVVKHPDADNLSIGSANGNPVIFRTGEYNEGDLAAYVPVDAIVPDDPRWDFLGKTRRIKARRLRGIFSMGLLTTPEPEWEEGQDVRELLNITKYDPYDDAAPSVSRNGHRGTSVPDPNNDSGPSLHVPVYDLESLRKYKRIMVPGEEVVLTEKLHGESARYYMDPERGLMAGSRRFWKKPESACAWRAWSNANADRLAHIPPGICVMGELYGNTDLKYDASKDARGFRAFDVFDTSTQRYFDYDNAAELCAALELDMVPVLYRGEWSESLMSLAEGESTLAKHVREGFVVQPVKDRIAPHFGRVKLKLVGQSYLLRKEA